MAWAKIAMETENTLHSASSAGPSVRLRAGSKTLLCERAGRVCCEVLAVTLPPWLNNLSKYKLHAALFSPDRLAVSPGWEGVHAETAKSTGSRGLSCVTGYRPSCRTLFRRAKTTLGPYAACQALTCQEHLTLKTCGDTWDASKEAGSPS